MADAPAHHLLVLLPPIDAAAEHSELPEILCVIQVCIEGALSKETVKASLGRGVRPSGDLIPWTLTQQFLHDSFAQLSGARIVRIAAHPALQRKGYATEALKQLVAWFEQRTRSASSFEAKSQKEDESAKDSAGGGEGLLTEELKPRRVPPLLESVAEIPPPYALDYVGTSFGLTSELYEFWRKSEFRPVYLRQTAHEATGERSCILLRPLSPLESRRNVAGPIIEHFVSDFRMRFLRLLQGPFRDQPTRLALSIVDPPAGDAAVTESGVESQEPLTPTSLLQFLSRDDIHRLEQYGRNLVEYNLVLDLVPALASLYLGRRMPEAKLSHLQSAILLALGCQHRTVDQIAKEFDAPASQLLALFNKAIHKLAVQCRSLLERQVEEEDPALAGGERRPLKSGEVMAGGTFVKESLVAEQRGAAKKVGAKLDAARQELLSTLTDEYSVAPGAAELRDALGGREPVAGGSLSVKRRKLADGEAAEGGESAGKSGKGGGKGGGSWGKKKQRH
eukprot:gnl/TRDRNA2_/TRDRNA2_87518_c0_seq1.p1 gnl/TRDRNA2_/TRDRNA2_87518_c0~~gnl/TRDRNA2_/TRDRNA2_87518_c0_seq1.p1  ORF type:complete len:578 (-),score=106.69 gnl/TRDRNA2_/TRDRNA2_87518_c0_seq1:137-1657(-)